ncbi:hypothetical protein AB0I35_05925 [Nocardia sp. NPDC050378]|uniref:hypothetical protein n=1 Tax=Nocardia sp. NPDC050378 TaxID=3155400 RepID=UPI0033D8674E
MAKSTLASIRRGRRKHSLLPRLDKGIEMSNRPWLERTMLLGGSRTGESRTSARYGPLRVCLPYEGVSNKPWIRAVVGKGAPIKSATNAGVRVWELSANHLLPLAAAMADRYGEIEMRIQVSPAMECSHSCQTADAETVWKCVCICAGQHHGGEGVYDDWFAVGRFRLNRLTEEIHVQHIQISRDQIPFPSTIPRTALARALPIPRTSGTVRRHNPTPPPLVPPMVRQQPPQVPLLSPASQPSDLGHAPTKNRPHTDPEPPRSVACQPRTPAHTGMLVAAAAVFAALGIGVWLLLTPDDRADAPAETGRTATVEQEDPYPSPEVADNPEQAPTSPAPAPAPVTKAAPHGCYPFQQNC